MFDKVQVLDHGYVQLIESWGSDARIIESARMSTGKGFLGWGDADKPGDEKLLAYLYNNKHHTPFEMAGIVIEVKAPIIVFREWHRHRTQSYNEMSARYVPLPDENYVPTIARCMQTNSSNHQANSVNGKEPTHDEIALWLMNLELAYRAAQTVYEHGLTIGIPKELARLSVPVARYSVMRASANLRNWIAFLTLRQDMSAQYEIRQYADQVAKLIELQFPRTYELYMRG